MTLCKTLGKTGFFFYYLFLIAGLILIIRCEKGEVLIWINENQSSFLDLFFKYWTYLGDGLAFAVLIFVSLMISYYRVITVVVAIISQTIVMQIFKKFLFNDTVRPKLFFEHFNDFHQVTGIDIHSYGSFPSGHTATAFTIAVLLSLFIKNSYATILLMIMAILVGISRVYLLQHFFIDIYFGSIVGFLNGIFVFFLMESSVLNRNPGLRRGLIRK